MLIVITHSSVAVKFDLPDSFTKNVFSFILVSCRILSLRSRRNLNSLFSFFLE